MRQKKFGAYFNTSLTTLLHEDFAVFLPKIAFCGILISRSRRKSVFRGILISQFQKLKEKNVVFLTNVIKNSLLQTRTIHGFKFSTSFSLANCLLLSIRQDFRVFYNAIKKLIFFRAL